MDLLPSSQTRRLILRRKAALTISFNRTLPSFVSLICSGGQTRATAESFEHAYSSSAINKPVDIVSDVFFQMVGINSHLQCTAGSQVGGKNLNFCEHNSTQYMQSKSIPSGDLHPPRCSPGELRRASGQLLAGSQCLQTIIINAPSTRPWGSATVRPTYCKTSIRVSNNTGKRAG